MSLNASDANVTNALISKSIQTLMVQKPANIVWAVFSSSALLVCGLQLLTTLLWKPLRKLDQSIIIALAAVDFVKSIGFGALAIRRLIETVQGVDDISIQRNCMYWIVFTDVPLNIIYFLINALSIDRLLALSVPVWYKNRKLSLKVGFIGVSVFAGCLTAVWIFVGTSDTTLVVACVASSAVTESYRTFTRYMSIGSTIVCLTLNGATCVLLVVRWHTARKLKKDMKTFKKSVELSALKTLLAVVLVYLATSATAALWRTIQTSLNLSESARGGLAPLSVSFEILRGALDFPLYVLLVAEYRNGFKRVILRRHKISSTSQVSTVKVKSLTTREQQGNSVL